MTIYLKCTFWGENMLNIKNVYCTSYKSLVYGNFYGCSELQHDQRIRTGIRNKYCAFSTVASRRRARGARCVVQCCCRVSARAPSWSQLPAGLLQQQYSRQGGLEKRAPALVVGHTAMHLLALRGWLAGGAAAHWKARPNTGARLVWLYCKQC